MYTLYYSPGACSMAVHVLLNELGVPFKLVAAPRDESGKRTPELLKLNPRGAVPVLVEGDLVIREGAAILTYLADKHESPLLPKSGRERAKALEWLMFANATLHPAYGRVFFLLKQGAPGEALLPVVREQIIGLWKEVDEQLAHSPYITGKDCTVADILLTVIANFSSYFPFDIPLGSHAKRLLKSVVSSPSYQKALATENIEYKAAA